jgi:AcrR family transcriptional regulator
MPKETFFNLPPERREAIIDVAIDEFAANDFRDVSISRIVSRAGIAKGSFYQYFENKQDIYRYLLGLMGEEKIRFLQHAEPPDVTQGIYAHLVFLFRSGFEFQLARPRLAQVAYRFLTADPALADEALRPLQQAAGALYRQLVDQGRAGGDIDPALDPEMVTFVWSTLMNEVGRFMMGRLGITLRDLAVTEAGPIVAPERRQQMERMFADLLRILQWGLAPLSRRESLQTNQEQEPT